MLEKKLLENLFVKGKISRRDFISGLSALGVAVTLSPSFFPRSANAAAPKRGGRLRIGCPGAQTSDSLDTATITNLVPETFSWQLRNCLVEIDHKADAIPELAESWESTPDATKWIFKLRKGIEFHNGKTLEAEDVIFSINHHRGKDSKSPAKVIVDPITEIKADGKHTISFALREGNADFPYLMSDYHLAIVPNGTEKKEWEKGIGTGGYILKTWEPGVRTLAMRNPNYWKQGHAHFDEVEMIAINDPNTRTSALITGEVDIIPRCDRKTIHLLEKTPGIQVIKTNGTKHFTIPMRSDMKPYTDNNVRLALKYAVDREHLLKNILKGHGTIGNDHPISPANRYYASELPQRKYDPDKAKHYLKKAGLSGHTFNLHTADAAFPGAVDVAALYKEHAIKAGININIKKEPNDGYWTDVWMKKEWCFSYWWGRPTEDWMFASAYAADSNWNEGFWKNDRFNKLLLAARAELDEQKRRSMYVEMQSLCRDDGGSVIPMFPSDLMAASSKLKFDNVASNIEMDGCKLPERWWFDS